MSTYYKRYNDDFYKVDGELIKKISLKNDSAEVQTNVTIPESADDSNEDEYASAIASVTKFMVVGGHPDIPPKA